ncbi:MAG: hypothetical protein ACRDPY_32745 [Streptosporangiaceae bacterium]
MGTVLCAINQLDILLAGRATGITWLKIGLTYLVANYGILVVADGHPGLIRSPTNVRPGPCPGILPDDRRAL